MKNTDTEHRNNIAVSLNLLSDSICIIKLEKTNLINVNLFSLSLLSVHFYCGL